MFEKDIRLKSSLQDSREAFPVINKSDSSISLFFLDKLEIRGIRLDKDLNIVGGLDGTKPGQYPNLVGMNISGDDLNLFFSGAHHNEFSSVSYNFVTNSVKQTVINLDLKKEVYLGSISHNNRYYILTNIKPTSTLKLYVFENHFKFDVKEFNLSDHKFSADNFSTLYYAFDRNKPAEIDNEVPNALDLTCSASKLYTFDNKIILSLDNQTTRTTLITIDLNTLTPNVRYFKKDKLDCGSVGETTSNSYIHHNILYQLKVCMGAMSFTVTDIAANKRLTEYLATKDDDLFFKNSPIFKGDQELAKTKQFLRKVSESNGAVSAYKASNGIQLTLGCYEETQHASAGNPTFTGPTYTTPPILSGFTAVTGAANPTYGSFNLYTSTKSIYFMSLLDSNNFKHKESDMIDTAFEKIKKFKAKMEDKYAAETLFKWKGFLVFGYYSKSDQRYYLRKFED